jgi:SAM-dependent methyltransferase
MQHPTSKRITHAIKLAIRRSPAASLVRRLVKQPHPLTPAFEIMAKAGVQQAARWLLSPAGRAILNNRRLLADLRGMIGNDIQQELLLTEVRKLLLLEHRARVDRAFLEEFTCALIQQCINNEYVYFVSDEEKAVLAERVSEDPSLPLGCDPDVQRLYDLLLYKPPHEIFEANVLSRAQARTLPGPLGRLLGEYMAAHDEEANLKEFIERLSSVEAVSAEPVAQQYENNPYPRWLDITLRPAGARIAELRNHFSDAELPPGDRTWDVLAAGCGTGRDTIAMASGYGSKANILAIDISRASLAYASRKTRQYGIQNVRFAQCDIHAVQRIERQFDIVECSGVLVTFKDPMIGWRLLVDRLRPGGLMYVALYSALARREIVKIREDVAQQREMVNADFIRRYRRRLMLDRPDLIDSEEFPNRWDFFSMSACRDLLFHVQEHQHTIPEIRQSLDQLGLEFRGFELPGLQPNQYWTRFPDGRARFDLDAWWEFEQKHPSTFMALYGFWSRKR